MRACARGLMWLPIACGLAGPRASDARTPVVAAGPVAAAAPAPGGPAPGARGDSAARGPTLLVPSAPDSAPPESPPGPLLIPGRPQASDSARATPAQRAREAYLLGRGLEGAGRLPAAIASYRNAIRLQPTIADANHRMAMIFLTRDQVGEAIKCLLAELEHHPDNVDASRELGICYARLGDHTRALEHLEKLARDHPSDGTVWHALGATYLAASRPRDAEKALKRALRIEPTTAEELRDLGATMAALGRDQEARVHYRRAVAVAPDDAASWLNLGNLEHRASRPDSAYALYRRAEAADSTFVPALEAQIRLLRERKLDAEVVAVYRRWLHHHPDHHGARLEAIRMLDGLDREDEGLALARDGVERVPESGQSFLILGMVLRGRGETREALSALRRAERQFAAQPAERERVSRTIAAIRSSAPESLQALFTADSIAAARSRRP